MKVDVGRPRPLDKTVKCAPLSVDDATVYPNSKRFVKTFEIKQFPNEECYFTYEINCELTRLTTADKEIVAN